MLHFLFPQVNEWNFLTAVIFLNSYFTLINSNAINFKKNWVLYGDRIMETNAFHINLFQTVAWCTLSRFVFQLKTTDASNGTHLGCNTMLR